uniref:ubiquitin carboxyl-terminal hydrolase 17-like protein D isoform X2 n=2 Tax=Gasterosteus aculeatus aculeatus TaxID=481459 RepID=UPI001A98DD5D|nr:ubiquitin carboxyl-terminal hydrolase 17-like protein D isoform X2 [Gasterosteus aculeatus aculeatus]
MPSYQATKYHGLKNEGATCYLNSVLQVLFMTKNFREAVKRHVCDNQANEFIDQLTSLFDDLQQHEAYTYNITKKLGIDNVYEQRDAAEYFEKILRLTSEAASQIFHGESTQKTKCSTCHNETDRSEAFWHLPLALGDFNSRDHSVEDDIEKYFRASHFSGKDQLYCDKCEEKSDATITCEIKHHPEVLMLLLKRFEFDYQYMTYVKINQTVKVPFTLQIPENQTYELYAVVDHVGDLRGGHYTATIRPQDDEKWYHFDDTRVSLMDYQPFQVDNFKTSTHAYLLFYRMKKVEAADTCTQNIRETSPARGVPPAADDTHNVQCKDAVKRSQEVEGAAKAGNEPPAACSTQTNEEAGIKGIVAVGKTPLGENINDPCDSNIRKDDVKHRRPQEVLQGDKEAKTKYPHGYAEPRDDERFVHERQNMYEDQEGKHAVSQDDVQPVKQEIVERIKTEEEEERKAEGGKLLTKYDLSNDSIQCNQAGKSKQNKPKDQQHKQQQKRRVDEHVQRKRASDRREQDQNGSSERCTSQKAVKRAKGDNEHVEGADSSLRRTGSSSVADNRGDGRVKKSQPSEVRTGFSEDAVEGTHNSKKSKTYHGKIIEEETMNGVQKITVITNIRITTIEGSSQGITSSVEYNVGNAEIKSDPKTDATVTLPEALPFTTECLAFDGVTETRRHKKKN